MQTYPANGRRYLLDVSNEERSALLWACELARTIIMGDKAETYVLLKEEAVGPDLLDDLADALFLAGCPAPAAVPCHVNGRADNGHGDGWDGFRRVVAETVRDLELSEA